LKGFILSFSNAAFSTSNSAPAHKTTDSALDIPPNFLDELGNFSTQLANPLLYTTTYSDFETHKGLCQRVESFEQNSTTFAPGTTLADA